MKPNAKQEEILNGFNLLRNEQRTLANKVSELTTDLNEHKLVLETLNQVEKDRRCFRMVGGVLVERNVGNVVPALKSNSEKMDKLIETLTKQLTEKGQEIQGYIWPNITFGFKELPKRRNKEKQPLKNPPKPHLGS
ncbi:PFDN2 [Lepeophtheirus salmonis]|uniref:PFDN2 n=1 Tax=Lepeophtheirus salmonis TaxID=72036 RepID=A0A7R8CH78_LEPSM|nr:PFDN2 [Lepeophtheirus salmonis]CAF2765104.1 PFDN2 [Lepeophtheirus salmonis]